MSKDLFTASAEDRALIEMIVDRYIALFPQGDKVVLCMDIEAVHCNCVKLRLADLLHADDFNLVHDVSGIHCYINRLNGKLERFFLPRFSCRKEDQDNA